MPASPREAYTATDGSDGLVIERSYEPDPKAIARGVVLLESDTAAASRVEE